MGKQIKNNRQYGFTETCATVEVVAESNSIFKSTMWLLRYGKRTVEQKVSSSKKTNR